MGTSGRCGDLPIAADNPSGLGRNDTFHCLAITDAPSVCSKHMFIISLGILGLLMALAYYANGRLTTLETPVEWLKDTIDALTNNNWPISRVHKARKR